MGQHELPLLLFPPYHHQQPIYTQCLTPAARDSETSSRLPPSPTRRSLTLSRLPTTSRAPSTRPPRSSSPRRRSLPPRRSVTLSLATTATVTLPNLVASPRLASRLGLVVCDSQAMYTKV